MRRGTMGALLDRRVEAVPDAMITGTPSVIATDQIDAVVRSWRRESDCDRWARRNGRFGRAVVRRGFGDADTVYAFNAAALEIFEAARARGLRCILDQTAAPWRWNKALLLKERERWPGWEDEPAEIDWNDRLAEREEAEWALADEIVCGSEFVRERLIEAGVPKRKIQVVSYPVPDGNWHERVESERASGRHDNSGPLKLLFVGTLQLRKGLPYLFEALRRLEGRHELRFRVVGPTRLSKKAMAALAEVAEIVGPVPRSNMAEQYRWADLLVLPTLSEGSANVCREAIAHRVPVLTTPNSGFDWQGAEVRKIEAGSARALAEAIGEILATRHQIKNIFALEVSEPRRQVPAPVVAAQKSHSHRPLSRSQSRSSDA